MQKQAPTIGRLLVMAGFALSCFGLLLFLWLAFGGSIPLAPKGYRFQTSFGEATQLEVTAYIGFVTTMILLFGGAFEFPLILLMLNFTGVTSARRLLSWWRVVIFLSFAFAAVATPDPGPFGMTLLASCMTLLYFVAVGIAFVLTVASTNPPSFRRSTCAPSGAMSWAACIAFPSSPLAARRAASRAASMHRTCIHMAESPTTHNTMTATIAAMANAASMVVAP